MGNLLFSPSGRIGPGQFMSGATILIAISAVLGLLTAFVPALSALGIVSLVLIWCWVVIWVKRYHDGGKSGWMSLVPIIVWLVAITIVGQVISSMFVDPEFVTVIEEATEAGDFGAIISASMGGGMTTTGQIVSVVASAAVSYVVAMIFNNMIKHDAHDNQFGPEVGTM